MNSAAAPKRQPSYEELLVENVLLKQQVTELQAMVASLSERIKELEDRLGKDSHNSSKPPSSDAFRRTKSLRKKSDKATGGQQGHRGKRLEMVAEPDEVVVHALDCCCACGAELSSAATVDVRRRQVFELPPLRLSVSEHQAEVKRCCECGSSNRALFPEDIRQPTQYGPRLRLGAVPAALSAFTLGTDAGAV